MVNFFVRNKLLISVLYFALWANRFFLRMLNFDESVSEILSIICKFLIFLIWLVVMLDIMNYRVKNKIFWILSMFFISFFTPVVYIYRRKNLFPKRTGKFKFSK